MNLKTVAIVVLILVVLYLLNKQKKIAEIFAGSGNPFPPAVITGLTPSGSMPVGGSGGEAVVVMTGGGSANDYYTEPFNVPTGGSLTVA